MIEKVGITILPERTLFEIEHLLDPPAKNNIDLMLPFENGCAMFVDCEG